MTTTPAVPRIANLIGGIWSDGTGGDTLDVHNPATGDIVTTFTSASADDVDRAVAAARAAQPGWAATSARERSDALHAIATEFRSRFEDFVALEVLDAGKPVTATRDEELNDLADSMRHFAGAARVLSGQAGGEYVPGTTTFVRREPVGVVAGITPWNFPLWQAVWKIVPALATGNAVVIKPAELTPLSTAVFAELAAKHLPAGVLNVVNGTGATVGAALAAHPGVNLVSFTGSTATGRDIARAAAARPNRAVLELGGNAPVIVYDDADLDAAAETVAAAGLFNAGQECMAATRLIVHEHIADRFFDALLVQLKRVVLGDPTDAATTLGPLISARQRDRVAKLVADRPARAELRFGGRVPDLAGYYFEPTLVTGLDQNDDLVQQEIFGPVLTAQTFTDDDEALAMGNGVDFGLAGSVWTRDVARGMRGVNALNFGNVWINNHLVVAPDLPIGGHNQSGYGKEGGALGIEEFTRVKQIGISLT